MTSPLTVSVPHRLGKDEAVRRLKGGMSQMATKLGALITIEQETWEGDTLTFQMRGFGQSASGTIAVFEDSLRIEVMLPWLLAKLGERLLPALKKETTLLLEKKP
jgi:Putative polyhydroxyalkanoic acid system protein (PHA_gran_rgn)